MSSWPWRRKQAVSVRAGGVGAGRDMIGNAIGDASVAITIMGEGERDPVVRLTRAVPSARLGGKGAEGLPHEEVGAPGCSISKRSASSQSMKLWARGLLACSCPRACRVPELGPGQ